MTCGKGTRTGVSINSSCTEPSTRECTAASSCIINNQLFNTVVDGKFAFCICM